MVGDTDVDDGGLCIGAGGAWLGATRSPEFGVVGGRERGEGVCDDVLGGARQLDFPPEVEKPNMAILLPSMGAATPTGGARIGAASTAEGVCVVSVGGGTGGGAIDGCTGAIGIWTEATGA